MIQVTRCAAALPAFALLVCAGLILGLGACSNSTDSCVKEGTLIETPSGARPVESLSIGDAVLSVDPASGEIEVGKVVAIRSERRVYLSVCAGAGRELGVTMEHPLLTRPGGDYATAGELLNWGNASATILADNQSWASAASLVDKQSLANRIARATPLGLLESAITIKETGEEAKVFDLTISSTHRNFIANGFVVHNKSFIQEQPNPIADLRVLSSAPTTLTLAWTTPGGPLGAPAVYRISASGIIEEFYYADSASPGDPEVYLLGGLSPGTRYDVTVWSSYENGAPSEPTTAFGETTP